MIEIEVSIGELVDRLSILAIKAEKFQSADWSRKANREYENLLDILRKLPIDQEVVAESFNMLKNINKQLWDLENKIRELDCQSKFDAEFVDVSRKIRELNDERAKAKNDINKLFVSFAIDLKEYTRD